MLDVVVVVSALASTMASFPVAEIDAKAMTGTPSAPIVVEIALLRTVVTLPFVKAVLIDEVRVFALPRALYSAAFIP